MTMISLVRAPKKQAAIERKDQERGERRREKGEGQWPAADGVAGEMSGGRSWGGGMVGCFF